MRLVVLTFLIASFLPASALADESWDKSHCGAAMETQDWPGVTVYCKAYAEDKAVDAQNEKGKDRAYDAVTEATAMAEVGLGYRQTQDEASSDAAYAAARQILENLKSSTHDAQILTMVQRVLDEIPQSP
jgi:hypothetical protein